MVWRSGSTCLKSAAQASRLPPNLLFLERFSLNLPSLSSEIGLTMLVDKADSGLDEISDRDKIHFNKSSFFRFVTVLFDFSSLNASVFSSNSLRWERSTSNESISSL